MNSIKAYRVLTVKIHLFNEVDALCACVLEIFLSLSIPLAKNISLFSYPTRLTKLSRCAFHECMYQGRFQGENRPTSAEP